MSSILDQNPGATVSEALEGVPEDLISRRESLRMRALIGAVPVGLLATEYNNADLAKVLVSKPGGKLADPTVVCGFTMPMSPRRIPVIAEFFLDYLRNGLPTAEAPAPAPAPSVSAAAESTGHKDRRQKSKAPRRGVEVTLADLQGDATRKFQRTQRAQTAGSSSFSPRHKLGKGRPAGSPADIARLRRGIQE